MATVAELLHANLHDVFAQRDPVARRTAIDRVYAADVVFTDPEGSATGRDALAAKAEELIAGLPPEFVFAEDGPRYATSDTGALAWALGPAGSPVVRGIDVVEVREGVIVALRTALAVPPAVDGDAP